MKWLFLVRHAKSDWSNESLTDHQRPLNKRGRNAAPKVGTYLQVNGFFPEVIVTSDAVRALTTAKAIRQCLTPKPLLLINPSLYHGGYGDIQETVSLLSPSIERLMLVGHNPGWEMTAGALMGQPVTLTTCNVIALTHSADDWSGVFQPGSWDLNALIRPKEI